MVVLVVLGALLAAPACVSVPLAPDRPELDHFVDARPTSAVVEVTPLSVRLRKRHLDAGERRRQAKRVQVA